VKQVFILFKITKLKPEKSPCTAKVAVAGFGSVASNKSANPCYHATKSDKDWPNKGNKFHRNKHYRLIQGGYLQTSQQHNMQVLLGLNEAEFLQKLDGVIRKAVAQYRFKLAKDIFDAVTCK